MLQADTDPAIIPADLPRAPRLDLIRRYSRWNTSLPLVGFRRGWLLTIRRQAAWAVRLWPVAQVWRCGDGQTWFRQSHKERSLRWLDGLRHPWVGSQVVARLTGGAWVDEAGQMLLLAPDAATRRLWWNSRHARQLVQSIPDDIMPLLDGTANDEGILLLKYFQLGQGAVELYRANRGIGFILACCGRFNRPLSPEAIARMVYWPQRRILEYIRFPDTELFRQVLRSLTGYQLRVDFLRRLRGLYHSRAAVALLQHTKVINQEAVQWLQRTQYREIYTPRLITEVAGLDVAEVIKIHGADDLQLLGEAARFGLWKKRPIHSLRHLAKQVTLVRSSIGTVDAPLPPPPTEGDLSIVPLRTADEMVREGRELVHCLGQTMHLLSALHGRSVYYKVLWPKRGTLEILRDAGGICSLGQFRWAGNEEPESKELASMDHRMAQLVGSAYRTRTNPEDADGSLANCGPNLGLSVTNAPAADPGRLIKGTHAA